MKKIDKKSMTSMVITDNWLSSFLNYMPNPDDIVSGTADSYDTYRNMLNDGRIKSLVNLIKTTALNFPFSIVQGEKCDKNVYDFIQNISLFKNMRKKQKRVLSALNYGFSVSELVWGYPSKYDRKWVPENVITRRPERFCFGSDWKLFLSENGSKTELNQSYKWLTYQHDPDDENPYGTSVLRCVYWPWMFKKAGYDFWLQATEKFSVKSVLALFSSDGDEATIQERANNIAEMLMNLGSGSSGAVGNVDSLKEIGMSGELSSFKELVEACDVQICYGLTGQSIATSKTDGGSLALGQVQADMIYQDCKGIALELQAVLQKVIDWTVELNYGPGTVCPQFQFDVEQKASWQQIIDAMDRGVEVSKSALYSTYQLPKPLNGDDTFIKESGPVGEFALSDPYDESKKKALNEKKTEYLFI